MKETFSFEHIIKELSGSGQGALGHTEAKAYLRHTHPMLGLDRILDHNFSQGWIHAVRAISCSQPVFEGHFPDAAIYPGTSLCQDVIQVAIVLFLGMTGPLKKDHGLKEEMTVVSNINATFGHPVPPGNLLDVAVWKESINSDRSMNIQFEARVRDFPFYSNPNCVGIKFAAALSGSAKIFRVKRKIYEGIGL